MLKSVERSDGKVNVHTVSLSFTFMSTCHMQPEVCTGVTCATQYDVLVYSICDGPKYHPFFYLVYWVIFALAVVFAAL